MLTLLKYGDYSSAVAHLQSSLASTVTSLFDDGTLAVVKAFQARNGMPVDGIVGPATIAKLGMDLTPTTIGSSGYVLAALRLGVDAASVHAFAEVETAKSGFLPDQTPAILFERHVFFEHAGIEVGEAARDAFAAANPDICNPERGGYQGGEKEYDRLNRAKALNSKAALESASWGMFQIMGYNAVGLHYPDVFSFVRAMQAGEVDHLESFVRFIRSNPSLLDALKNKNWADCALHYNGPDYAANHYDTKLAAAYAKYNV